MVIEREGEKFRIHRGGSVAWEEIESERTTAREQENDSKRARER